MVNKVKPRHLDEDLSKMVLVPCAKARKGTIGNVDWFATS